MSALGDPYANNSQDSALPGYKYTYANSPQNYATPSSQYTDANNSPDRCCPRCSRVMASCVDCKNRFAPCVCSGSTVRIHCSLCEHDYEYKQVDIPMGLKQPETRPICCIARKIPGAKFVKGLLQVLRNGNIDHWALLVSGSGSV